MTRGKPKFDQINRG